MPSPPVRSRRSMRKTFSDPHVPAIPVSGPSTFADCDLRMPLPKACRVPCPHPKMPPHGKRPAPSWNASCGTSRFHRVSPWRQDFIVSLCGDEIPSCLFVATRFHRVSLWRRDSILSNQEVRKRAATRERRVEGMCKLKTCTHMGKCAPTSLCGDEIPSCRISTLKTCCHKRVSCRTQEVRKRAATSGPSDDMMAGNFVTYSTLVAGAGPPQPGPPPRTHAAARL